MHRPGDSSPMRSILLGLALLGTVAVAGPSGLTIDTGVRFEFTDCASGGSANQTVTGSTVPALYLMRVTDSDVFLCYGSTCASGGEKFPLGTVILISVPASGQIMSCRSSASTGDIILTRVR